MVLVVGNKPVVDSDCGSYCRIDYSWGCMVCGKINP